MAPSPKQITNIPPVAGVKRSAASLLPAFEPLSPSPALPRVNKRIRESPSKNVTYPTPVPTSSTLIPTSSPTADTVSRLSKSGHPPATERTPLGNVPMIELPWDGRPVLLGRSSIACDHQLSSNRLISRVHVTAAFKEAISDSERDRVTVTCTGWNGIKIHRRGAVLEIKKGETFSSDQKDLDVILDVQDSRVCLKWPTKNDSGYTSVSSDDESASSPTRYSRSLRRHSTPTSPIRPHTRFVSPVSPSPGMRGIAIPSSPPTFLQPSSGPLVIYEDEPGGAEDSEVQQPPAAQSDVASNVPQQGDAKSSSQPKNSHDNGEEFSDPDEENDPIIHSFGPAGANLLPRMASVVTHARQQTPVDKDIRTHIQPLRPSASPPQTTNTTNSFDTRSHVINQLAFSRLASTPLSTIISHLPVDVDNLSSDSIREIMMQTRCIGEVTREGKDAAGKALESEFYYIPDEDEDELRREAVVKDLRKPGLRACRKQHKQYFWRKPK